MHKKVYASVWELSPITYTVFVSVHSLLKDKIQISIFFLINNFFEINLFIKIHDKRPRRLFIYHDVYLLTAF